MNNTHHPVTFGLFDKENDVDRSKRYLPHWFQPNVAVFLTFRTADSLPRQVIERWQAEQREMLRNHGWKITNDGPLPHPDSLPASLQREFRKYRDRRWHWHLDSCHGECALRNPQCASIVADSLLHFNGTRYDLDRFVVMPNHVHLLVQFRPPTTCRKQSTSWLRYTATGINCLLGRKGAFWQSEPFDHLVRSVEQFEYLQRYIGENPAKAKLRDGEFLFWKR